MTPIVHISKIQENTVKKYIFKSVILLHSTFEPGWQIKPAGFSEMGLWDIYISRCPQASEMSEMLCGFSPRSVSKPF